MSSRSISRIAAVFSGISLLAGASGQNEAPKYQMGTFYLAFLVKGPKWTSEDTPEVRSLKEKHVARILELGKTGKVVLAGPIAGDSRLQGVGVLDVPTAEEAKHLFDDDPTVKAGFFSVEIHPWYAAKGIMKMPGGPLKLDTYYLGFLRKGSNWTPGDTPESQKVQEGHMANINRLAALGKLVIAGPVGEDDLRGIFVFKTATPEEAKALADTDPAIKAGQLIMDLHQWMVPAGSLP
jgi:uncharacterized protein